MIKKGKENKREGYVLISVLVILMVMVTLAYFFADALFSELSIARNQRAGSVAFHLAEAGVQEAMWRIQNDASTRNTFINSTNGVTNFSHDPALVSQGSYQVAIQNNAKASAQIEATGYYQIGLKTAKRRIVVSVTQATSQPPYSLNAAIFSGGATGNEDINLELVHLTITGSEMVDDDDDPLTPMVEQPIANLISNRDIWFTNTFGSVAKDILAKRNIRSLNSAVTAGGTIGENSPGTYEMPSVDVSSDNPNSYKTLAIAQNQYFTAKDFDDRLDQQKNLTFNGVVYIAGGQGLVINRDQSVTVNGVLAVEGSIDVQGSGSTHSASLIINHIDGQPSGVIALSKITIQPYTVINITGLVYVGDRFLFDPYYNFDPNPAFRTITINGGLLCRRLDGKGIRDLVINYNRDIINEALTANPITTPVIQTQHWEEEY